MEVFPIPWLRWMEMLSTPGRDAEDLSSMHSHLHVQYLPEKNKPPHCALKPEHIQVFSRGPRLPRQAPLLC